MLSIITSLRKSFNAGAFDHKMLLFLAFCKILLWLTLVMNALSVLMLIFSKTSYYYEVQAAALLDVVMVIIFYGTFYLVTFVGLPVCILIMMIHLLFKHERKMAINLKPHLRLIVINIILYCSFMGILASMV
ncbi:MAG TPA: hypothetical protein VGB50_08555 [Flavobacterium sp.]|jgi:hypothetical protein